MNVKRLYELSVFSIVELKKALDGTKKNARVYRIFALSVFVLTVLDCTTIEIFLRG